MARPSADPLKNFIALRNSMVAERTKLQARLAELNGALGEVEAIAAPAEASSKPAKAPKAAGKVKKTGKRPENELSLKEAVLKVLGKDSATKEAIYAGVLKVGYKFAAKNPINSLNTLLYGSKKPKFKNQGGKFSVG